MRIFTQILFHTAKEWEDEDEQFTEGLAKTRENKIYSKNVEGFESTSIASSGTQAEEKTTFKSKCKTFSRLMVSPFSIRWLLFGASDACIQSLKSDSQDHSYHSNSLWKTVAHAQSIARVAVEAWERAAHTGEGCKGTHRPLNWEHICLLKVEIWNRF